MDFNGKNLSTKLVRILFAINVFAMLCFIFMAVSSSGMGKMKWVSCW